MKTKDTTLPPARINKSDKRLIARMAKRTNKSVSAYIADAVTAQALFDERRLSLGIDIKP
jgi:uncharacterized protein (DUF1778 family)